MLNRISRRRLISFAALMLAGPASAQTSGWGRIASPYGRPLPRGAYPDPSDDADMDAPYDVRPPLARRRGMRAALPPDADPNYSSLDNYDDEISGETTRRMVADPTGNPPGTITIDTRRRRLDLSLGGGRAWEYGIGVGRAGFAWKGRAVIGRKAVWPGWTPPKDMLLRRPDLPTHMDGGIDNPLGARALYLFQNRKDTLFRIHGTNEPDTIGRAVSSGCIRMLNADVVDLYRRVAIGTPVDVL